MKKPILIKKGAEANLYLANWHGRKVIMKKRPAKRYRVPELDEAIKIYRTNHEPQLIHEAKEAGVSTPTIFLIDRGNAAIIMEFIEGTQVKRLFDGISQEERLSICYRIGQMIGRLHRYEIIHGDLTTSNMIFTSEGKLFLVDFGLGEKSNELEARGVDLHLMKRALQSTHFRFAEECFQSVADGYSSVVGALTAKNVLHKVREIERRGRYIAVRNRVLE